MTKEELDKLWSDKSNWTRFGFYKCASDPRFVVPKRVKWMGWTANIGHGISKSIGLFVLIVAIALAPLLIAISMHPSTLIPIVLSAVASLILVSVVCHFFATRSG